MCFITDQIGRIGRVGKVVCLSFLALFLTSCGGGSDSGFLEPSTSIRVSITADKTELPANLTFEGADPRGPFTNTFVIRVERDDGSLFPAPAITTALGPGLAQGALFYLDGDPEHEDDDGNALAFRNQVFEETSGIVTAHFHASDIPGTAVITASVQDPNNPNQTVSATLEVDVLTANRPVSSLTFAGPFINAVIAGLSRFGDADNVINNGVYHRVVSIIANDANGLPALPNTQINFYLVSDPVDGFPGAGPGSFFIAGSNGDPQEGGYLFTAAGGEFISKGVRRFDRLVLDGINFGFLPDNRDLTSINVIASVLSEEQLTTDRFGPAFDTNAGIENGASVPYIIGRAQRATILATGFTNVTGVADTLLTYPASQVGRTAVLVACTTDNVICTVLNTCDAEGQNCGRVFLPVSDGSNILLTASATELGANTSTPVELCLEDVNGTPIQATVIEYDISGAQGAASVTVNDDPALAGSVVTSGNGCVTVVIASSGQVPGTNPITVTFTTDDGSETVVVNINGPGQGNLDGVASCDLTEFFEFQDNLDLFNACSDASPLSLPEACFGLGFRVVDPNCPNGSPIDAEGEGCNDSTDAELITPLPPTPPAEVSCTFDLQLTDDRGGIISGIQVTHTNDQPISNVVYNPASGSFGITDESGNVMMSATLFTGEVTTITFSAGTAEQAFAIDLTTGN